jgi:hypothetical protein
MPQRPTSPPPAGPTPRRDFLRLAALAPAAAALSSCATASATAAGAAARAAPPPEAPSASEQLAAIRAVPLAPDAEPAFVFRARGARGRGP